MSAKKKRPAHQRALASSNKGDWYALASICNPGWRARISAIRNSKTSSGASNEPADHLIDPHRRPGLGGSQLEQGRQVLRVGAEEKPGAEVMELRAVRLRYAAV